MLFLIRYENHTYAMAVGFTIQLFAARLQGDKFYIPLLSYARSKRALVGATAYIHHLQKSHHQDSPIPVVAVHPGIIQTGLASHYFSLFFHGIRTVADFFCTRGALPLEYGCKVVITMLISPHRALMNSGSFIDHNLKMHDVHWEKRKAEYGKLWACSEKLLGLEKGELEGYWVGN